jgi:hypothetical protein
VFSAPEIDRLLELAAVYGIQEPSPTLGPVAERIISRTEISEADKEAVLEVINLIVRDEGTLATLESGEAISDPLCAEMVKAAGRHNSMMPATVLVALVVTDVRAVCRWSIAATT